jgi:hypothetical protein
MEKRYFCWYLNQNEEPVISVFKLTEKQYNRIIERDPIDECIQETGYSCNFHQSGMTGLYRNTVKITSDEGVINFLQNNGVIRDNQGVDAVINFLTDIDLKCLEDDYLRSSGM